MTETAVVLPFLGSAAPTPEPQAATEVHQRVSTTVFFAYYVESVGAPGKAIAAARRSISDQGEALDRLAES